MRPDILTCAGHYFDFVNPERSIFTVEDVAHHLSLICRFTGAVREMYSVAQHSVEVSHVVPPQHALAGLLHDAAEAFIGDVSRPLKNLLPDYKVIERRVEAVVLPRLGVPAELPPEVKWADQVLLATEKRDLMPAVMDEWETEDGRELPPPLKRTIRPWTSSFACQMFLARYRMLTRHAL